jgi:hypothetical protein
MATDTEAEFRRGRIVAFRKTGDFHIEREWDAARLGLTLSEVCRIAFAAPVSRRSTTRAAARRMMPGDLTDALE